MTLILIIIFGLVIIVPIILVCFENLKLVAAVVILAGIYLAENIEKLPMQR